MSRYMILTHNIGLYNIEGYVTPCQSRYVGWVTIINPRGVAQRAHSLATSPWTESVLLAA